MAKLKDILKRHVVALDQGLDLGKVQDILLHPSEHRVACLVVRTAMVSELAVVCRAGDVRSYDEDTLAIRGLKVLMLGHESEEMLDLLHAGSHLRKRPMLTSEGKSMGRIRRVDIDAKGDVVMYHVAHGLFGLFGRAEVAPKDVRVMGGDVAVIKPVHPPAKPKSS